MKKKFLALMVFCWPGIYLYNHIFAIGGKYTAMGNDFISLYYKYKIYLLACLAEFRFPLWSPSEGAGFPFYTNPFAQAFYPLNLPLVIWYKISGGYNAIDHQVFAVLGISIFALGLFMWLRLLNSNIRAVVFSVLIMSVSFKMTEILRFPNAVHSAAWYPWVLYALTRITLSQSAKKAVAAGMMLVLFMVCLCTAGYPYYVYYSAFLFAPYMLIFWVRPLRTRFFGSITISWRQALITLATAGLISILLCGPYLLGVKNLMAQTTDRTGKDFNYSTEHIFNLEDTAGSLVYPPAAQAEGWYFFSITGLLIISLYLFNRRDIWAKVFFITWIAIISYISYGRSSYLFELLWRYLPGFSSLRVWGRLNIILVPILAWLMSIAYSFFESEILGKKLSIKIVAIYGVILCMQLYLRERHDYYWIHYFKNASDTKFIIHGAAGFTMISLVLIFSKLVKFKHIAIFALLFLAAVFEIRPVGAYMWTYESKVQKKRFSLDIDRINESSFKFRRTDHENSISLKPNFSAGTLPNWYFNRYIKFLKDTNKEPEARKMLLGIFDGRKIFFSESINHTTVKSFLRDALRYQNIGELISYNGDELRWTIEVKTDGYFSFIDNWDKGWRVFIDEKPAEIKLLLGTFKSVRLSSGLHHVKFSYQANYAMNTNRNSKN